MTAEEVLPGAVGETLGTGTGDIRITIARIIRYALGFLGTIALLIILYAGFLWMTAKGDADQIDRAKKTLTSAVIGLVIIMSAFAITSFVISRLVASGAGGLGGPGGSTAEQDAACIGLSATCPAGALGHGILESHYPARNAVGIPRNTRVVITFKEPIQRESIVLGGDNPTVAILKSVDVRGGAFGQKFSESLDGDAIEVIATADLRTFAFIQKNCPDSCFGSPTENIFYTVALRGGNDGVRRADGSAAFRGTFAAGYAWEFQVSTVLDLTPPRVAFTAPRDGENGVPRNSLAQVTFSEAVDPVSVAAGFSIARGDGPEISGQALQANGYKTVEFRSDEPCGTNSCGETVYCLPGGARIDVTARAAALAAAPPTAAFPPNGVTDMAGNSLDGDGDGAAQGPGEDDFSMSFSTSNAIDLVPPKVVSQEPGILEGEVPRDIGMSATFSKLMSMASFTSEAARLVPGPNGAPTNYWIGGDAVSSVAGEEPDRTRAIVSHDLFSVNQPYAMDLTSGLRDLRQNCFYPGGGESVCTGDEPFCCNGAPSMVACGFLN